MNCAKASGSTSDLAAAAVEMPPSAPLAASTPTRPPLLNCDAMLSRNTPPSDRLRPHPAGMMLGDRRVGREWLRTTSNAPPTLSDERGVTNCGAGSASMTPGLVSSPDVDELVVRCEP